MDVYGARLRWLVSGFLVLVRLRFRKKEKKKLEQSLWYLRELNKPNHCPTKSF